MNANEKLKERMEAFDNVFNFRYNKHVPTMSNVSYWPMFDAGITYKTFSLEHPEVIERVHDRYLERYQFDAHHDICVGMNAWQTSEILKTHGVRCDESGESFYANDFALMEPDEYPEWIEDKLGFDWTKAFARNCEPGLTMGQIRETVRLRKQSSDFLAKMKHKYIHEYGTLLFHKRSEFVTVIETVFNQRLRGMKGTALDLRRLKSKLNDYSDALYEMDTVPMLKAMAADQDREGYVAPLRLNFLSQSILNVKQFETMYWPYVKKVVDFAAENNLRLMFYVEAEMLRFAEFFQDVPKGLAIMQLEQDDIREVRKAVPNIALCGGMPTVLLNHGTKEECIDYAKELIDTMGDGFALCQDKLLAFRNDAKGDNLKAVNDFVRSYDC